MKYTYTALFTEEAGTVYARVSDLKGCITTGKNLQDAINNPDASVGVCCSHKVVTVGFNTLCYDAERCRGRRVLNPPHE